MQKIQRQGKILKIVKATGQIEASKLYSRFSTTRETLRKDLLELEEQGLIIRSYGKISKGDENSIKTFLKNNRLLSKKARQLAIEEKLNQKGEIRLSSLAEEFGVTIATIRNDINDLKQHSNILKNHGTALFDHDNPVRLTSPSLNIPLSPRGKKIAKRIINLIKPGDTIYLNRSHLCQHIASILSPESQFSVITDSLDIVEILSHRKFEGDTITLPGVLDIPTRVIKIRHAESLLSQININIAVALFSGFESEQGFYVNSFIEKENLEIILSTARETIVCIESSDIGVAGKILFQIDPFRNRIHEILVDDSDSDKYQSAFNRFKIPVTYCGVDFIRKKSAVSTHKIGFLYTGSNSYYAKTVRESVETAINNHEGLSLIGMSVNDEVSSIIKHLDYMIQEKVECLILYISNFYSGQLIAERCHQAHLKLLSIDISIPNSFFYGVNNSTAASIGSKECTQFIEAHWDRRFDRIISLSDRQAGLSAGFRLEGMIHELQKQFKFEDSMVQHMEFSTLLKLSDKEIYNRLLSACGKRNIFLSFNEKITSKIHPIITNLQSYSENILIGHNYNNRVQSLMEIPDSPLIGCIAFHPENYGRNIIEIIESMVEGREVKLVSYSPLEWISNQSHKSYIQGDIT